MRKIKITKETVGNVAKVAGTVLLYGLAVAASRVSVKDAIEMARLNGNVKYSDAVSVIMDSNMFSSDKSGAIKALAKDKDAEYYRAVIKVVKSNMFSGDKIKLIAELCNEEES